MRFEILNVEHGFCAYAVGSDGGVVLFDCGHSVTNYPSIYLPSQGINHVSQLFITNYDEDHISDLANVQRNLKIDFLVRNESVTSRQIRSLKKPPISPAMENLLHVIHSCTYRINPQRFIPAGLQIQYFHNHYPQFTDTNNLSLLIFLRVGNINFALGGDLEKSGWLVLLQNPGVQRHLKYVNVFVASHHGRRNGYCSEVFKYCRPNYIVMSDGSIKYDTQKMAGTYAKHASGGLLWTSQGRQEMRKVLTTRKDGNIFWEFGTRYSPVLDDQTLLKPSLFLLMSAIRSWR